MVVINPPLAIYKHLAALSFMLAGVFADLLVVRLCLSSAYICLIVNGVMGSPFWPSLRRPGHLTVDMLIWGFVCLYVHMASVVRLLLDERHVELSEHEEALWRMFYRVGGLSRKLFYHHIAAHMKVKTYQKGQSIPVDKYFHITYKGTVTIQVHEHGKLIKTAVDGSGCVFDLKSLGLLQAHTSPLANHVLIVTARSDCTFFQFNNEQIREIANARITKSVWQTVLIGILARLAVQRPLDDKDHNTRTDPYHIDPLFAPLSKAEVPDPLLAGSGAALERPLAHVWYCMQRFFTPPWPFGRHLIGVRHNMLAAPVPTEGATSTLETNIVDGAKKNDNGNDNDNSDEIRALLNNRRGGGTSSYTLSMA